MKQEIQNAYDRAAPDRTTAVRIYERIMNADEAPRRRSPVLRRALLAAATVAVLAATATAGYAAYQHWHLPEPDYYERDESGGIYREHGQTAYTQSSPDVPTEPQAPSQDPLSDEAMIRRGLDVLTQVGLLDVRPEQLTVVRQENLYWAREEVELRFDQGDLRTTVKFDAGTGKFLGMSGVDWQLEGSAACGTDAEAAALAQRYYEALPVEQGYALTGVEKYDEQYWSYDFCREAEPGVYNPYEMVRISVNPVSGRLTGCTVFYVPLLDDHEPGQERLTQEQAEQVVQSKLTQGMELTKAEVVIGLPNWMFTEYQNSPNRRASNVTRWAWKLTYERPNSAFADRLYFLVDCYTGELLGGDMTK